MGSRKSTSAPVTTTTQTDARQVVDAGGGIVGSGNTWDQSTSYTDSSSTSANWWQDNSDRSTSTWTDASQTTITTTDPGAFLFAGDFARAQTTASAAIARDAIDAARRSSEGATAAALRATQDATAAMSDTQARAFGLADSAARLGYQSGRDALGWAAERFDTLADMTGQVLNASRRNAEGAASTVAAAYSSARDAADGTRTLTIAAMAAVGLVAALVIFRKG